MVCIDVALFCFALLLVDLVYWCLDGLILLYEFLWYFRFASSSGGFRLVYFVGFCFWLVFCVGWLVGYFVVVGFS